jgi:hypothetical protein
MLVKFTKITLRILAVLLGLAVVIVALFLVFFPRAELPPIIEEDVCARNNIRIDTTSIETIYSDPEGILADPDKFVQEDRAYQLFANHRTRVNDPFQMAAWVKEINKLASLPEDERNQQIPYRLYKSIQEHRQAFCQEVVSNVLTYLPEGTDLEVTIYLTAHEGSAAAFTSGQEIAFSLSSPLLVNTALIYEPTGLSSFFNLALHELFHAGFGLHQKDLSKDEHRKNEIVIDLLAVLQNEGMATYTSYRLNPNYPTPFEWFVYLIDKEPVVSFYLGKLNRILADGSPPPPLGEEYNELYRRIGTWGYRRNGLYIVGGYMAKTIEEALGHEALVQTVEDGFYAFAETYNSIADEDMKVVWEVVP